jgi:signal transduction histidine kinase
MSAAMNVIDIPQRNGAPTSMSAASMVVDLPTGYRHWNQAALQHELVLALATADDLVSAMARVVDYVHRRSGATRVEWWMRADDGSPRLGAATGMARGRRQDLPLGRAGVLAVHGDVLGPELRSELMVVARIIRRRAADDRLARTAIDLARRNEALEDFAALVAHELKTPLHAALLTDDPSRHVQAALEVVDALLEAAVSEPTEPVLVSAADSVARAVEDVGGELEVTVELRDAVLLPPAMLRVIVRNLLANAISAGARHVHVAAERCSRSRRLSVVDDGIGLADADGYATGSGLGLWLAGRIAARFGGVLELVPNPSGGTRALLEFPEASP